MGENLPLFKMVHVYERIDKLEKIIEAQRMMIGSLMNYNMNENRNISDFDFTEYITGKFFGETQLYDTKDTRKRELIDELVNEYMKDEAYEEEFELIDSSQISLKRLSSGSNNIEENNELNQVNTLKKKKTLKEIKKIRRQSRREAKKINDSLKKHPTVQNMMNTLEDLNFDIKDRTKKLKKAKIKFEQEMYEILNFTNEIPIMISGNNNLLENRVLLRKYHRRKM